MTNRPAIERRKGTDGISVKTLPPRLKRWLLIALGWVFSVLGVAFIVLGVVLVPQLPDPLETLLQRIVKVLIIGLSLLLGVLAALFIALSRRLIILLRNETNGLLRDETTTLLTLLQKSFEFLLALAVLLIGLFLLLDTLKGSLVAAPFSRVGGPTRVETAVEASRFWRMPPQRVVTTSANAPQETMLVAARCAMLLDAPLLFTSRDRQRQRLVDRTIDAWRTRSGPGGPPRTKEVEVPNEGDVTSCVDDGGPSYPPPDGLSTLEVPNRQLDLPCVQVRKELAPVVVFAAAKGTRDPPDVAVALALAAHMAREDGQVSLLVVPHFLEADPELQRQLHKRRELVTGGVVLGQTGVLPEDTRALLRQLLTSTDRSTILGELQTTLGSLTPLIAALVAFLGALIASKVGPNLAEATSRAAPDLIAATSRAASGLVGATSRAASDVTGLIDEGRRRIVDQVDRVRRPRPQREADRRTGLHSGQGVTVWLRSGWRVTGKVNHGKPGAEVRAVTFLQLNAAKLARDGYESEETAEVIVPIEDIELIKAEKPVSSSS